MQDLGLTIIRTTGRASSPPVVISERELTPADLVLLSVEKGSKPPALKRIRDAHHSIARLVSEGRPAAEISAITGYSQSRLSILKSDPAFAELVEFYRGAQNEVHADVTIRLQQALLNSIEIMNEKLEDTPADEIKFKELRENIKVLADRTGFGPAKTTQVDVRIGFADRLEAARARMRDVTPAVPLLGASGTTEEPDA